MFLIIIFVSLFAIISCQCHPIRVSLNSTEQCSSPIKPSIRKNVTNGITDFFKCFNNCDCRNYPAAWTQVGHLNMNDSSQSCPSAWEKISNTTVRGCGRQTSNTSSCDSVFYSTGGISYTRICGQIIGYQFSSPNAFHSSINGNASLESWYIDGVSLTHGPPGSRTHVWSFVNAYYENIGSNWKCPCMLSNSSLWPYSVPAFVGNNYFCATGSRNSPGNILLTDNPLWDGEGCTGVNTCCQFNHPPWFCRTLPEPTTEDLEVRICADQKTSNENIYISNIELFVR